MNTVRTYSEPIDRKNRLSELGVTEEQLQHSIQAARAARANCTKNHPPQYPGFSAWAEGIRTLRDELMPQKWRRETDNGLPLVVREDGNVAITYSSGDEWTGSLESEPCTRSPKGPRTAVACAGNEMQYTLALFSDMNLTSIAAETISRRTVWVLLVYMDEKANEIRSELSTPTNMNTEGRID